MPTYYAWCSYLVYIYVNDNHVVSTVFDFGETDEAVFADDMQHLFDLGRYVVHLNVFLI